MGCTVRPIKSNSIVRQFIPFIALITPLFLYQNCSNSFKATDDLGLSLSSTDQSNAPTLTIGNIPEALTNSNSVNVSFSAMADEGAQIASIKCTLNSLAAVDCLQGFNRSNLEDGNYILRVIATDDKGLSSSEKMISWVVDTTPPTANFLTAPSANGLASSTSVNITFSQPTDMSGISNVICSHGNSLANIGSNLVNCANNSITISNLVPGPVFVRVRVTDNAKNVLNLDRNFTVQFNIPSIAILDPKPAAYSNVTSFTFTFSGAVNGQNLNTFECALDAQNFTACNGGSKLYPQADLTEGSHTFRVRAVDAATNTRSGELTHQFTIDRTGPAVAISAPAAGATLTVASTNAVFTVTDTNLSTVTRVCRLDGNQLASCNSPVPLNGLSNGSHTFSVTAVDGANNSSISSRNFSVSVIATVNRTLSWDPSLTATNMVDTSVTSYRVYVGTVANQFNAPITAAAGAAPSMAINSLVVGQTYYFAVSAVNSAGEGDKSTVLTYVAQ